MEPAPAGVNGEPHEKVINTTINIKTIGYVLFFIISPDPKRKEMV